ncbi:MAG TPA: hypothetical protein VFP91_00500 [Vicinamibacterales bacterium]|nr:hypothetical protein [Vicinamibacterales bacterium]
MADVDLSKWSGEGTFTQTLVERLKTIDGVTLIRVEDAPASRSEADYNFMSNEIFVVFETGTRREPTRRFGVFPGTRDVAFKKMSVVDLEQRLASMPDIGSPDYSDEGMLQYLRTERIIPPYQTKGYKLVELVRIYEAGTERAGGAG